MKRLSIILLAIFVGVSAYAKIDASSFALMRQNFRQNCVLGPLDYDPNEPHIHAYLMDIYAQTQNFWTTMRKDTTFLWDDLSLLKGVPAYTPFHVHNSYMRLEIMARAWAYPGTSLYQNTDLLNDIRFALGFLYKNAYNERTPICGNWWEWRIGNTESYANIVSILYDELTPEEIKQFNLGGAHHVRGTVRNGNMTYANLADVCRNLFLIGILTDSENDIRLALSKVVPAYVDKTTPARRIAANDAHDRVLKRQSDYEAYPAVWKKEGLYEDGTFIQHIAIPYIGTYGAQLVYFTATVAQVLDTANFVFPQEIVDVLPIWITKTFFPALYKGEVMLMFMGRGNARNPYQTAKAMMLNIAQTAKLLDNDSLINSVQNTCADFVATDKHYSSPYDDISPLPVYKPQIDAAIQRAQQNQNTDAFSIVLAAGDRVIHQTPNYRFCLAMSSNRIGKFEAFARTDGNENNYGWYTGDGMTYLYSPNDPRQYWQYIPNMNHYRVPGTTVDLIEREFCSSTMILFDNPPAVATQGLAGGVMLGNTCSAMMQLVGSRSNLTAKKSWFCFDNEIVCLGSDINLDAPREVITTVENRQFNRQMYINGRPIAIPHEQTYENVTMASIDGTGGYIFLDTVTLHANVSNAGYNELWLSHDTMPSQATYNYILLPMVSPAAAMNYASQPDVVVLANTPEMQAVREQNLHITAINFWKSGKLENITSDGVAAVMMHEEDSILHLNISDPTWDRTTLTISLDGEYELISSTPEKNVQLKFLGLTTMLRINTHQRLGMTQEILLRKL